MATAGCSNDTEDDCEELCRKVTDCRGYCDEEGPSCNVGRERERDRVECVRECVGAAEDKGGTCEDAISSYGECVERHSCGGSRHCSGEETRYFDSCFAERTGAVSCSSVCNQLEYGCHPYELFGYRGPDCEDVCLDAAKEPACGEALFSLEECEIEHADPVAPCLQIDSTCLSEAEAFVERCDGFAPTTVDADEEAFCSEAAVMVCICAGNLYPDPECEPRTTDQCLFQLWAGEPCRRGWQDYVLCLQGLPQCNSSSVYDNCQTQSAARLAACQ